MRAAAAFLRLRTTNRGHSTGPFGLNLTQHFRLKCSHAISIGAGQLHVMKDLSRSATAHACNDRIFSLPDLRLAEAFAIWQAQLAFPPPKDVREQLNLISQNGIFYVRGRLEHSSLCASAQTPYYVPRDSVILKLLVMHFHKHNVHAGVSTTLSNVRTRFWFTHGRRTVAWILRQNCPECRHASEPHFAVPQWPPLPADRVNPSRPYAKIGADFFGPVLLKSSDFQGQMAVKKYYVLLITCLSVRAVHCELMSDLSTDQFFHAFKRFTARRGWPTHIMTDNGSQLLAARQVVETIQAQRRAYGSPAGGPHLRSLRPRKKPADAAPPINVPDGTRHEPTDRPHLRSKRIGAPPDTAGPPGEIPPQPHIPRAPIGGPAHIPREPCIPRPPDDQRPTRSTGSTPSRRTTATGEADPPRHLALSDLRPHNLSPVPFDHVPLARYLTARKRSQRTLRSTHAAQSPRTASPPPPPSKFPNAESVLSCSRSTKVTSAASSACTKTIWSRKNSSSEPPVPSGTLQALVAVEGSLDPCTDLAEFFAFNDVKWSTITDRAAWRGGSWERMVGLVKTCLTKTLGRSRPTVDTYQTLLSQAEWTVNCRPLSYTHNSDREAILLRPIDFIIPQLQGLQPQGFLDPLYDRDSPEDPDYELPSGSDRLQRRLIRDLTKASRLIDHFWKLWRDAYLLDMRREFGKAPSGTARKPQVDDIVLVFEDNTPRTQWRLARIRELIADSDGVHRSARIRLSGTGHETRRALPHLYPIGPPPRAPNTQPTAAHFSRVSSCPSGQVSHELVHVFATRLSSLDSQVPRERSATRGNNDQQRDSFIHAAHPPPMHNSIPIIATDSGQTMSPQKHTGCRRSMPRPSGHDDDTSATHDGPRSKQAKGPSGPEPTDTPPRDEPHSSGSTRRLTTISAQQHGKAPSDPRLAGGMPNISAGYFPTGVDHLVPSPVDARTDLRRYEPSGSGSEQQNTVLRFPEFDDDKWDFASILRSFPLRPHINTNRWSICVPGPKKTGWEPLDDCRDHVRDERPHLRIQEAVPNYSTICKEKGGRRPACASEIGRLTISSFGKMYAILWGARHHLKPKRDPSDKNEAWRANKVVLDFINSVARSRSSELPELVNRYFDDIRTERADDPFMPYDFQRAIMRWFDGCPSAADFLKAHPSGPIYFQPDFLNRCRHDIREAYLRVAESDFVEALEWCRMRSYQVHLHFQRPWTTVRELAKATKDSIVKVCVNQEHILQEEHVFFSDSWGLQFTGDLRPNVQVIRLPDVPTEALAEAKKYFMGHLVRKLYWFGGAAEFNKRPDGYLRLITNVSKHFSAMFPHVHLHIALPPYTDQPRNAWHTHLHCAIHRHREIFPQATLMVHPTDVNLCIYFDECEALRLGYPPWPTSLHTKDGHLSTDGLHRRKKFMEMHYEVTLWHHRDSEEEALPQRTQESAELGQQSCVPDGSSESSARDLGRAKTEEPSGSTKPNEENCQEREEPSGSARPDKERKASSYAAEQAGHSTATDKDDSEAHLESDEESEDSDPYSGPSHGQDWD